MRRHCTVPCQRCWMSPQPMKTSYMKPWIGFSRVRNGSNEHWPSSIQRVVLVGDRGVLTSARIREDLKPAEGIDWITALRAPSIQQLVESGSLQMGLFDEKDLAEISDPAYPGERLIACKNPILAEE